MVKNIHALFRPDHIAVTKASPSRCWAKSSSPLQTLCKASAWQSLRASARSPAPWKVMLFTYLHSKVSLVCGHRVLFSRHLFLPRPPSGRRRSPGSYFSCYDYTQQISHSPPIPGAPSTVS